MITPNRTILMVLISSLILVGGCKKNDAEQKKVLPEATQQGKNTIGFVINGDVWLPDYKCSSGGNACGEMEVQYGLPFVPDNTFFFHTNRRREKLSSFSITVKAGATVTGIGDKTDSIRAVYTSEAWNGSTNPGRFTGPLSGSRFVITKLDRQAGLMAGEFELIMADTVDDRSHLTLEQGRFDVKFNTCKCSN